jgi:HYR domain/FG-GAP-like repeat
MKRFRLILLIIGFSISFSSHWPVSTTSVIAKRKAEPGSEMRNNVALPATGRVNPRINVSDGQVLPTCYTGAAELELALQQNRARPLALASADFDEDGIPDLVSGYANANSGILTLHRGNADSIYPNSPEARQRRANGEFIDSPFLPEAHISELPEAPEFLGAGDFDADGHWDVVAAARGSGALYLLRGNGRGEFEKPRRFDLPGRVTAMVTGDINRRDGLTDLVVGITGPYGPQALAFEGPKGALRSVPEAIDLPAEATAFAIGQMDDSYEMDIAIAAGKNLLVVHGRDRKLSLDDVRLEEVSQPTVTRLSFPFSIDYVAVGDFIQDEDRRTELALLASDGTVQLLKRRSTGANAQIWQLESSVSLPGPAGLLVPARVSNLSNDNLIVIDAANHQLHILMDDTVDLSARPRIAASLDVDGEPVAVLPMRLNADAQSDLIVLKKGQSAPSAVMTESLATSTVTNTNDSGQGSLREALESGGTISFNIPGPGPYVINLLSSLPPIAPAPGGIGPVTIDGTTQPGFAGAPIIVLNGGGNLSITALDISAGNCVVRGLAINGFGGSAGITLSENGNNIIEDNYIGVGTGGNGSPLTTGNSLGIDVISSSNNLIGGTTDNARNVIAANNSNGIQIRDNAISTGNQIQGNYLGTNAAGTAQGSTGTNGSGVVFIGSQSGNTVGGTTAGARNVISGHNIGVNLGGNSSNLVQGNYIGTDFTGTIAITNAQANVNIATTGSSHTVGGTTPAARNILSGGAFFGVTSGSAATTTSLVQGNYIGTQADGTSPLGNQVGVNAGGGTMVGGTVSGAGNLIAFNTQAGVQVAYGSNPILSNSIHDNGALGIDLLVGGSPGSVPGVTPNDSCDGDTGANNLQNFPILISAISSSTSTTITGTLDSIASTTFRIEFFSNSACDPSGYGEGETSIGSAIVVTDSGCNAVFTATFPMAVSAAQVITATATRLDLSGSPTDTSEFSSCIVVQPSCTPPSVTMNPNDQSVCQGTNANFTAAANNNTSVQWQTSTDGGASFTDINGANSTSLSFTAMASQNGNRYRAVFSSNCGTATTTAALLTVDAPPTPAITPNPTSVCANSTGNQARGPADAKTYAWAISNGTITAGATSQTVTYTAGASGSVTMNLTVTDEMSCSTSNSATVPINQPPTTATVGGPQILCSGGTTAALGGNTPTSGTGTWTVVSGGTGSFNPNANTPNATFTHSSGAGPIVLRWTISNPPCPDLFAEVTITIKQPPTTATVGPNQSIPPGGTTAPLDGNTPSSGTGLWTIATPGFTGTFNPNASTPSATWTNTGGTGQVKLRWTISNSPCTDSFAEVTVQVGGAPTINCPGPIAVNAAQGQCSASVSFNVTAGGSPQPTVVCKVGNTVITSPGTFNVGASTINCTASNGTSPDASCSFTVTVNDTQPPAINCPANVSATAAASCPLATGQVVGYKPPQATDNCAVQSVVCNPPSGSTFPVGSTTVTCTATDTSNNVAQCSFTLTVGTLCLQDETNAGNVVVINAATGEYRFLCSGVLVSTGRGTLNTKGCIGSIEHNKGDRRVYIEWDTTAAGGKGAGTAIVQVGPNNTRCQITDKDMSNNACT